MLMRLRQRSISLRSAIAIGLLLILVAWLAFFIAANVLTTGRGGGCSYILIMDGQPAYVCPNQPPQ
jgi:hypothetical protein